MLCCYGCGVVDAVMLMMLCCCCSVDDAMLWMQCYESSIVDTVCRCMVVIDAVLLM